MTLDYIRFDWTIPSEPERSGAVQWNGSVERWNGSVERWNGPMERLAFPGHTGRSRGTLNGPTERSRSVDRCDFRDAPQLGYSRSDARLKESDHYPSRLFARKNPPMRWHSG